MTRRVTVVLVAFAAVLLVAASSQRGAQPPVVSSTASQTGTGMIAGVVVDAATNRPIAGAMVVTNLRTVGGAAGRGAGPGPAAPSAQPVRLVTGADGRFVLHDLPKISVTITASADGYVNGSTGQSRPGGVSTGVDVGDGERIADVRIQLWKAGVITGTVTDEIGEPVVSTSVRAARRIAVAGRVRYTFGNYAATDDRGVFRLAGLQPGDYVVVVPQTASTIPTATLDAMVQTVATGTPAGAAMMDLFGGNGGPVPRMSGLRVDDQMLSSPSGSAVMGTDGRVLTNQTVFYPSATSIGQASPITIRSGEVRSGVDVQLRLVPTARISGVITVASGQAGTMPVRLISNAPDDALAADAIDIATTTTRADGAFTFLGVPPGQFLVSAVRRPRPQIPAELASNPMIQLAFGGGGGSTEALYGSTTVNTDGRDVADLTIAMTAGATVSGRFVFERTAQQPPPQQLRTMRLTLQPLDGRTSVAMFAMAGQGPPVDANGEFKTTAYPVGKYLVTAPTPSASWIVKSILAGGRDVLREPLELKNEDIAGVVVTYTDKIGQVAGSAHAAAGATLAAGSTVFLFPADYQDRIAVGDARLFRNAPASKTGAFTIGALPAGDYYLAALAGDDVGDNRDEGFFNALSRVATHVTLTEGERKTLDLQVSRLAR